MALSPQERQEWLATVSRGAGIQPSPQVLCTCPNKHTLKAFLTTVDGYSCDVCDVVVRKNVKMWGCRKCDHDICRKCTNRADTSCYRNAPPAVRSDRKVTLAAVRNDADAFEFADVALRRDRDFVKSLIDVDATALRHAHDELKCDLRYLLPLAEAAPAILNFVYPELLAEAEIKDLWLKRVRDETRNSEEDEVPCGYEAYRDAPEEVRADKEVTLAAVTAEGNALEHAPEALQRDKDVVLAAVRSTPYAFMHATEALRDDRDILAVVRASGEYSDVAELLD